MRKCFSSRAAVAVAIIILVVSSAPLLCQAQLLSSFEGNLSSSVGANWEGPGIPSSQFTSVGATDGASALEIRHATTWDATHQPPALLNGGMALAQQVATHDFLTFDVTTIDNGVAGDGWSPAYQIVWVVFNSPGGYRQSSQFDIPVASDGGGSSAPFTVVLDLSLNNVKTDAQTFVSTGGGTNPYYQLILPMIGADQGTPVKAGDYADNSVTDAADYVAWRKSLGSAATLPNETVTPGSVDQADYAEWRSHFGTDYTQITTIIDNIRFANAGSGSLLAGGVPEPSSITLALAFGLTLSVCRRSRY